MWVVLVVCILNKLHDDGASRKEVLCRFQEIPDDLQTLLCEVITRDTRNKDQLAICLEWILFSIQPLSPEQLYFAIHVGLEPTRSSEWDRDDITYEKMCRFILNCSKGLVEITGGKHPRAQFIHESVRELFLQGDAYGRKLVWPDITRKFLLDINNRLYTRCLSYLSVGMIRPPQTFESSYLAPPSGELRFEIAPLSSYPFLEYALREKSSYAAKSGQVITAGEYTFTRGFSCIRSFERFSVPTNPPLGKHVQKCNASVVHTMATFEGTGMLIFTHINDGDMEDLRVVLSVRQV
ncbi:hypothetical protein FB567DRAFT_308800 [Paraphoma chrysanthemicola]|uniref:Uncharacterized protein n=1 Tax=Paraphoma chrysanthemicola TaxID=798071 RepID=A0A8K0W0M2_9PLEO|nr:hypothetical protein FB567DRAFT_308800 [Paraphoma chrysanthemicola]